MQRRTWVRLAFAALLIVGLPWLFLRSVRNTVAEPYAIDSAALSGWTVSLVDRPMSSPALVALEPPPGLVPDLFQQIFHRTMESMTTPGQPAMPIVLRSELIGTVSEEVSAEVLLDAARRSGLEGAHLEPVCMAVRREPSGGRTRQLYLAVFDAPALDDFRSEVGRHHPGGGNSGVFDPAALDFVLPIASSDANFQTWWPLEIDREAHCVAGFAFR